MRAERAARTRAAILAAAGTLFPADGYAGTTMRAVARAAGVSVPTVEQAFGTKASLLKAAIDVAIAGDDEPVAVLDRPWAGAARATGDARELLRLTAGVLAAAQARSAGLMLALFEATAGGDELYALRRQMVAQREITAAWLVDRLAERSALRPRLRRAEAVDTVWALIDPALFDRLTRHRGWTVARYERWIADTLAAALLAPQPAAPSRPTRKKAP
ncbi:MAG: helix-turn-helix domain-containing protein [Acidimicrobiales bacterium]